MYKDFKLRDAKRVKAIEKKINHDVKSVEYFVKEKIKKTSLKDLAEFVHFALTSEDVTNLAHSLMIKDFLNDHYFGPMGEIAYTFNGTVDKHIGDSIMVVFGAPVVHEDDVIRAVKSAKAMQKKAIEFIDEIKKNEKKYLIDVSPRIVIGFMRICKALTKMEMRSKVEEKDIERVKEVLLNSLIVKE